MNPERPEHLIGQSKMSKVSRSHPNVVVSIEVLDAEQAADAKQKALRLFCRAMIRLYIQDNGNPENGKRLGIL